MYGGGLIFRSIENDAPRAMQGEAVCVQSQVELVRKV